MARQVIQLVVNSALNILIVLAITFVLLDLSPVNEVRIRLGNRYNERDAQALRHQLGLDRSLPVRFVFYLERLARGDFGVSGVTGANIGSTIRAVLPVSGRLIAFSIIISSPWLVFGILAALRDSRYWMWTERSLFALSALPLFAIGVLVILIAQAVFGINLLSDYRSTTNLAEYLVPALLLAIYPSFVLFRTSRDTLGEALQHRSVLLFQSLGFSARHIIVGWVLRSCLVTILVIAGNLVAYFLTSIYIVESLFSLGGFGSWVVNSSLNFDYYSVVAAVVVTAVIYRVVASITTMLVPLLDPRTLRS